MLHKKNKQTIAKIIYSAVDSNEASTVVVRGAPYAQALAQPRLPVVALLETLPRPTKTPSRFLFFSCPRKNN